jgi:hypothetical protein
MRYDRPLRTIGEGSAVLRLAVALQSVMIRGLRLMRWYEWATLHPSRPGCRAASQA